MRESFPKKFKENTHEIPKKSGRKAKGKGGKA